MEFGGGVYQSTPASKAPSLWEHRERLSPRVQDVQMFVCGSLRLASLCSNVNVNINAVKRRWTAAPAPWPKQEPGGCEGGKTRRSMMVMMTNAEVYIIQAASGWAGRQGSGKENTQNCDEEKKKKKLFFLWSNNSPPAPLHHSSDSNDPWVVSLQETDSSLMSTRPCSLELFVLQVKKQFVSSLRNDLMEETVCYSLDETRTFKWTDITIVQTAVYQ